MRELQFDASQEVPEVSVTVLGPRQRIQPNVIFDTGCGMTQIDVQLIETAGYSASDALHLCTVQGVTEHTVEGYVIVIQELTLFGIAFKNLPVLTYDFDAHPMIDGLLGFDVIKRLHLEMNGPLGMLRIFSSI